MKKSELVFACAQRNKPSATELKKCFIPVRHGNSFCKQKGAHTQPHSLANVCADTHTHTHTATPHKLYGSTASLIGIAPLLSLPLLLLRNNFHFDCCSLSYTLYVAVVWQTEPKGKCGVSTPPSKAKYFVGAFTQCSK